MPPIIVRRYEDLSMAFALLLLFLSVTHGTDTNQWNEEQWSETTSSLTAGAELEGRAGRPLFVDAVDSGSTDEATRWTATHNKYRCMHNAPAVEWSADLAKSAQSWADRGEFKHSNSYNLAPPEGPAGENLAQGQSTLEDVVKAWYSEVSDCTALPGCDKGTGGAPVGHFTAVSPFL